MTILNIDLKKRGIPYSVIIFLIACFLFDPVLNGQEKEIYQPINLESVLEMGGANNLTILEYKQRHELAVANVDKAREWWLPDIYAGFQTQQLAGATMNSDGRFFLDVGLNNLWMGIGLDAKWDFADGIYKAKAAKLKTQAAHYLTKAERNKVLLKTIEAYYDLVAAQMYYQAYRLLAAQADTVARQMELQVKAGLQYESDLLLAQSNINHLKIEALNAQTDYRIKSAELTKLLNLDPNLKLMSIDTILSPLPSLAGMDSAAFESAYGKRPEITAEEINIQSLEMEKKTVTTGLLIPELRLNTYISYFGNLYGAVNPMFPSQYPETNQLYPTGALNLALMWKIPLGRLTYAGDLKQYQSRLIIKQTKIEQLKAVINAEILAARASMKVAKEQMEIALEGNGFALKALQQTIQRQQLGTARPFEVLQAQAFFIKVKLDYIKAVANHNKAIFALKVARGEDL
jgi:outer membrane protein TolC